MTASSSPALGTHRPVRQLSAAASALWERFPPRPVESGWAATSADRAGVLGRLLAPPFLVDSQRSRSWRRSALIAVLDWLETQPGRTWQERWQACGAGVDGRIDWRPTLVTQLDMAGRSVPGRQVTQDLGIGLTQLICGDVLRPSQRWLLTTSSPRRLCGDMGRGRDADGFAALTSVSAAGMVGYGPTSTARQRIAIISGQGRHDR